MKFQSIGIPPEQAQFLQTREFKINTIKVYEKLIFLTKIFFIDLVLGGENVKEIEEYYKICGKRYIYIYYLWYMMTI